MPLCANCDTEREVDEHGNCKTCGSSSIIHFMHPLTLLKSAQALLEVTGEPDTPLKRATLDFVAARYAQKRGITLGQHLENTVQMWGMSLSILQEENKSDDPPKDPRYN